MIAVRTPRLRCCRVSKLPGKQEADMEVMLQVGARYGQRAGTAVAPVGSAVGTRAAGLFHVP